MKKLLALTLVLLLVAGCSAPTLKLGMGMVASMTGSNATAATADADAVDGKTQADVTVCAVTLDGDNKIVGISFDVVQCKATFTPEGAVSVASDIKTKKELGDDYGMRGVSAIGKEVNEQIVALEEYAVGKTVADVVGMPTFDRGDGNHTDVPDVEELKSSCTITVGAYLDALDKAAANAK